MKTKNKDLAIALRQQGKTYKEISEASGYSIDWCKKNLKDQYSGLVNDIKTEFSYIWHNRDDTMWPLWIDDIVSGVARLDWYGDREQQIPLSTTKIIRCFCWLDIINIDSVMKLLDMNKRMAQHYLKACQLCYPWFKKSLEDNKIKSKKYPHWSIVSEQHGIALGYDK